MRDDSLNGFVFVNRSGMEVLPECAPIVSPLFPVRLHTQQPLIGSSVRALKHEGSGKLEDLRSRGKAHVQTDNKGNHPIRRIRRLVVHELSIYLWAIEDD